jgi:hypothetical protein
MKKFMYFAKNITWPQDEAGIVEFREQLSAWYRSIENSTVDSGGPVRVVATISADGHTLPRGEDELIDGYGIIEVEDVEIAKAPLSGSPLLQRFGADFDVYEMLPGVKDH